MWKRLLQLRERRRQFQRLDKFKQDIERYRKDELTPRGLERFPQEPFGRKRRRQVYLDNERVWKFYRTTRRDARNFVAASRVLEEAAIPAPRVEFADASEATHEKYRLSCVVMNRLEGQNLKAMTAGEQRGYQARFVARLHRLRSDRWGECYDLQSSGYFDAIFVDRIRTRLRPIESWLREERQLVPPDFPGWFMQWREQLSPLEGQYSLVSTDVTAANFLQDRAGEISIIDLDRARYLDFPVDLVQLLNVGAAAGLLDQASTPEALMDLLEARVAEALEIYFQHAPPGFREHWRRVRLPYLVAHLIQALYGRVRRRETKFSVMKDKDPVEIEQAATGFYRVLEFLTAAPAAAPNSSGSQG